MHQSRKLNPHQPYRPVLAYILVGRKLRCTCNTSPKGFGRKPLVEAKNFEWLGVFVQTCQIYGRGV